VRLPHWILAGVAARPAAQRPQVRAHHGSADGKPNYEPNKQPNSDANTGASDHVPPHSCANAWTGVQWVWRGHVSA
jgi:hypothetical protein